MGSTGPGQAHNNSSQGALPPGGVAAGPGSHALASPRKQGQPGPPSIGGQGPVRSMLGPPVSPMVGGGPGAGQQVLLPGMVRRPGQLENEYGRGPGGMGPNGQTVEPLNKRPR